MVPLPLSTIKTHFHPTSMFLFSSPSLWWMDLRRSAMEEKRETQREDGEENVRRGVAGMKWKKRKKKNKEKKSLK